MKQLTFDSFHGITTNRRRYVHITSPSFEIILEGKKILCECAKNYIILVINANHKIKFEYFETIKQFFSSNIGNVIF